MCLECKVRDERIRFLEENKISLTNRIDSLEKQLFANQAKIASLMEIALSLGSRVKLNPTASIEDAWMIADLKKLENETKKTL